MESFSFKDITVTLNIEGARKYTKVSYPIRYGTFSEIRTPDYLFQFNLNGEIKHIQGRGRTWLSPAEWLKRTVANDWVYYSAGDYKGVYELFGEYYFPCLSYPSNSVMGEDPFENDSVKLALRSWRGLRRKLKTFVSGPRSQRINEFLIRVSKKDEKTLEARARRLHRLIGGRVTVLPPDTRHVDYDVIPIMVADGCVYHCGFCRVKSRLDFTPRRREDICSQIRNLKTFYGRDLPNYRAIFLGQHDALRAGPELLELAATEAYEHLEFERATMKGAWMFLFASADALVEARESLFEMINGLPYRTTINVGLESADPATLAFLKKPIARSRVQDAFIRMLEVNRTYANLEVTANFVLSDRLSPSHFTSLHELVESQPHLPMVKGTLYLSPLIENHGRGGTSSRAIIRKALQIKIRSPLPTFLYLIQRL